MPASHDDDDSSSTTSRAKSKYAGRPLSPPSTTSRRIPLPPAVLRGIFASSRSALEERSISRIAFFRFAGFVVSCIGISFFAWRGRAGSIIKPLAAAL